MYKVFFNDKKVILTDEFAKNFQVRYGLFYKYRNINDLKELIRFYFRLRKIDSLYLFYPDIEELREAFVECFEYLEAAGGLVRNKKNEYLFIYRRNKWDLPKGKANEDEKIDECAIREVKEECGISGFEIKSQLISTYHSYEADQKLFLKKTYWYEMYYKNNFPGLPQAEEEITKIKWFEKNNLDDVLANTYPTIIDVLSYVKLVGVS